MSNFFKSKKPKINNTLLDVPDYARVRSQLSNWLQGNIGKTAEPYPYEIVPPMTAYQKKAEPFMEQYAETPITPELVNLGAEEIKNTLTGKYNPAKSLYYKSFRNIADVNTKNALDKIADLTAGAGRYWTGARAKLQSDVLRDTTNNLNLLLGKLSEAERARRLNVLPQASAYGTQIGLAPLTKASNILNVGNVIRSILQQQNQANYQEWLRQRSYPLQIAQLANAFQGTMPPQWQTTVMPGKPSAFSRIAPALIGAGLGFINPALLGATGYLQGALTGGLLGLGGV